MEYSKGSWRIDVSKIHGTDNTTIVSNHHSEIGKAPICEMLRFNPYPIPQEKILANAKLIAAAPEMLEALKYFKKVFETITVLNTKPFVEAIEKVLKKATE